MEEVIKRLNNIEHLLNTLINNKPKDYYTPKEIATIVGKAEYTVSEWCRLGRIVAKKGEIGRGGEREWRIPHSALEYYRNEGLLPEPHKRPLN